MPGENLALASVVRGHLAEARDLHSQRRGVDVFGGGEIHGNFREARVDDCAGLRLDGEGEFRHQPGHRSGGHVGLRVAEGQREIEDFVVVPEDDITRQDFVGVRAFHFPRLDGEEVGVAELPRLGEHFLGEIAAGIGVGGDGFPEFVL